MDKKICVFIFFSLLFIYSCSANNTNMLTIAVDNVSSPLANITYIEGKTCSFNNEQYVGVYNDNFQSFNFSALGSCTNVIGSNIQLFVCMGSLTGTYNNVAATCSLSMVDKTCVCDAAIDATPDQIITAQKITDGIDILMAKAVSAKNSLFNNPNLCTAQTADVNPRHVCPCNLIQ
ncbi:MAG: hypothetical protein NTY22_03390 [Proteobacteria bacterium]|nr:hypothetical protein [Pseudomonadota bacterium]